LNKIKKNLFLLFFIFCSFGNASQEFEKIRAEFEAFIDKARIEWEVPGVAVGVVKDGKIIFEKGFGKLSVNDSTPVDSHTVFHVASLTKVFLVHLIGQLVDEGLINLDDPVHKYWPEFKLSSEKMTSQFTIRDLISHRSGLPPFTGDTFVHMGMDQKEVLEKLALVPLKSPLRSKYAYQNQLFGLASLIVEKVAKEKIEVLFEQRIFKPLGMEDSSTGVQAVSPPSFVEKVKSIFSNSQNGSFAWPHHHKNGGIQKMPFNAGAYLFNGSTGVNSSIHDMALWTLCLLNQGKIKDDKFLIKPETLGELRKPHIDVVTKSDRLQFPPERIRNITYGIGHFSYEYGEGERYIKVIGHMGGISGVRGLLVLVPSENLGLVILSNMGAMRESMLPEALREKFLDLMFGFPSEDWSQQKLGIMKEIQQKNQEFRSDRKKENPRPKEKNSYYVGIYESPLYGLLEITEKGDYLEGKIRGRTFRLSHWNGSEFNFDSSELSSFYGDAEEAFIEFGGPDPAKATLCAINLLFEGDGLFKRVESKG
jgi:CubicO group peptidase (beta-lactamase class C family)